MLTTRRPGLVVTAGLLLVMLAGLMAELSYAQRWRSGGGGGGFYRPSYTQMQPRTMPVSRPMPSQMQSRPVMQQSRVQPGTTGNRGFVQQQGPRTVRQFPPSIRQTAPIARVPSYTGRVTPAGSPILATRTGRAFAVPQQATFSTRMSLMSGTSRPALMARMGEPRRLALKEQFGGVAKGYPRGSPQATQVANRITAQKIASGHAFEKHVVTQGEFAGSGIRTRNQFARHITNVTNFPTAKRDLSGGRTAYWHEPTKTVVIMDQNPKRDGGTAFQPKDGRGYFDKLK